MKKIVSLLLLSIISICCFAFLPACSEEPLTSNVEGVFELSKDGTYYIYSSPKNISSSEVIIPSTYNNKPVKQIAQRAFLDVVPAPTKISLPDSITFIDDYAFLNCVFLTELVLSNNLQTIGTGAFNGCKRLTTFTIPDSVTSIGNFAFENCIGLTNIYIGKNVNNFTASIFKGANALTSITVNNENPQIKAVNNIIYSKDQKSLLMYNNGATATSYTIPDGVTKIGEYAFYKSKNLRNVSFNSELVEIGQYAFSNTKLTSVTLSENVKNVGRATFESCLSLTEINLNKNLETIGEQCFKSCKLVTSLNFVNDGKLKVIPREAFEELYSLTTITIPDCVETIKVRAFYDCPKVKKIVIGYGVKEIEGTYSEFEQRGPFTKKEAIDKNYDKLIIPRVELKNKNYWGIGFNHLGISQNSTYSAEDYNYGFVGHWKDHDGTIKESKPYQFKTDDELALGRSLVYRGLYGFVRYDTLPDVEKELNMFTKCKNTSCQCYLKSYAQDFISSSISTYGNKSIYKSMTAEDIMGYSYGGDKCAICNTPKAILNPENPRP